MALLFALTALALLAVGAAAIYPGELSYLGRPLHRWLYDRSADTYERKWRSPPYRDRRIDETIVQQVRRGCTDTARFDVLDLGCGTGRATRLAARALPTSARFVAVDLSPRMLGRFRAWLATEAGDDLSRRVEIVAVDVGEWLDGTREEARFGAVLMLEVAEFLPDLPAVLAGAARVLAPGGSLVMTRPAGLWWLLFPGRRQSRAGLDILLRTAGFEAPAFIPWRSRYEILVTRKAAA